MPFVLFAIRETIQEPLGFSLADLVFGHTPQGPLKVLKEHILSPTLSSAPKNVLDYVSKMRERLHATCALAQRSLSLSQKCMKLHYDKEAVGRSFAPGGSSFSFVADPWLISVGTFLGHILWKRNSVTPIM